MKKKNEMDEKEWRQHDMEMEYAIRNSVILIGQNAEMITVLHVLDREILWERRKYAIELRPIIDEPKFEESEKSPEERYDKAVDEYCEERNRRTT